MSILENLKKISTSWTTILTLIGIFLLFLAFIKIKKVKFSSRLVTHISLAVAMSVVLQFLKLFQLPFGGSATLGSMLPIILISLLYGPYIGIFTGFVYGILNFIIGPAYILHPIQVLFDYTLPFMAIGLAGLFKDNKFLATSVAFGGKFLCHFIAGVVFWGSYAADYNLTPVVYSFLYNGSYVLVDALICIAIISVIDVKTIIRRISVQA